MRNAIVECAVHRPLMLDGPCRMPRAHVDLSGHPLQPSREASANELSTPQLGALDNSEILTMGKFRRRPTPYHGSSDIHDSALIVDATLI